MYSGAATVLKKFALCALILLACMFVRGSSVLWDAFTSVHDNVDGDSIELNSNGFDVSFLGNMKIQFYVFPSFGHLYICWCFLSVCCSTYASLGVFVLQFERGIKEDTRRKSTIKSVSAADRSQKVAQLKGHQPGGSFAFVLPEAIQSRQISWELHFVFRDSRNRLLVKDVFRLPM